MTFNALSCVGAFVVVVSLITTISSCEKYVDDGPCYFEGCLDCCADNPRTEFINWYFYDVGSYHIYENQRNGQVDTVLVTDFWAGHDHNGLFGFYAFADVINRGQNISILFTENKQTFSTVHPNVQNKAASFNRTIESETGTNHNYALIFPMFVGNKIKAKFDSESEIIAIHSSITIGGVDYYNVVEINVTNDSAEKGHNTRYFVAKHIGIVRRMDLDTGDDWQLTEYSVVSLL